MKHAFFAASFAVLLAGCSSQAPKSDIAIVDVARISANWPKYMNYQNQMNADASAIQRSNASQRDKQHQIEVLQQRFAKLSNEIAGDLHGVVEKIAADGHYRLVLTREFVGYGGTDITGDVEKALAITEHTPKP